VRDSRREGDPFLSSQNDNSELKNRLGNLIIIKPVFDIQPRLTKARIAHGVQLKLNESSQSGDSMPLAAAYRRSV
jgi:hypothetical protein